MPQNKTVSHAGINFYRRRSSFSEETEFLKISHIIIKNKISPSKQPKHLISIIVIVAFALTILIASNKSYIRVYLNETKIKNVFKNEFTSNVLTPKEESKLTWKDAPLNLIKVKREVNQLSKAPIIPVAEKDELIKRDNPKISLIVPVFNKEKYLKPLYASIRNQTLKDIEIIFIDDKSVDSSRDIIKEYMKEDKRIVLVENEVNKRTFFSRNYGAKIAKGKYILIIDSDDLLLNNILEKSFYTAEANNLDITQFYILMGNYQIMEIPDFKYTGGILYQPHIKDIFYYGKTRNLCDKLIRRDIFLKSIDFMNDEFKKDRYEVHDDDAAFYGLIHTAKSYGFLEQIGYFYNIKVPGSTTKTKFKSNKINSIFKSLFTILNYYFTQSENNRMEKVLVPYQFFYRKVYIYKGYVKYLSEGFDYIIQVLDKLIKCELFTDTEKFFLERFYKKVIEQKKTQKL